MTDLIDQIIDEVTPDDKITDDPTDLDSEQPEAESDPPSGINSLDDENLEPTDKPVIKTEPDDVQAKLASYENETAGLRRAISEQRAAKQAERDRAQALEAQLNEVTRMIQEAQKAQQSGEKKTVDKIPLEVEYDDDGNASFKINPDFLKTLTPKDETLLNEVATLKSTLATVLQDKQREVITTSRQKAISAILAEDEGYHQAMQSIDEQFKFLDSGLFDTYLAKNGLDNPRNAEEAISMMLGAKEVMDQFHAKFPGADVEALLEAKLTPSPRLLKRALRLNTRKKGGSSHTPLPDKPEPLLGASSVDALKPADIVRQVANMDMDEILNLSDAEFDKVMAIEKKRQT